VRPRRLYKLIWSDILTFGPERGKYPKFNVWEARVVNAGQRQKVQNIPEINDSSTKPQSIMIFVKCSCTCGKLGVPVWVDLGGTFYMGGWDAGHMKRGERDLGRRRAHEPPSFGAGKSRASRPAATGTSTVRQLTTSS
jgi:hypothetical protein